MKKSVFLSNFLIFFFPLYFFTTCTRELTVYASFRQIERGRWKQDQEYTCEVLLEDSILLHHIDITGRFKYTYPFDSLSLAVTVTAPSGGSFCDTLSFGLTNSRHQLWGEFRFPYCSGVRFTEKGVWRFSFCHNMEEETLHGVTAIGVFIEVQ